jgi:hypothetical protein
MDDFRVNKYEQVIDRPIACDSVSKQKFPTISLTSLWASWTEEYPEISEHVVGILLPFTDTYLCENSRDRLWQRLNT